MIHTKEDLRRYIEADNRHGHNKHLFVKWLTRSDEVYPILFMKYLRYTEYYANKKKSIFDYIPYVWYWWNYRRLKIKTGLYVMPNCVDEGFFPVHPGFMRIGEYVKIGKNCTILPMVLIGKSNPISKVDIIIGNNCYISTGVTILGPVTIGDNVTIGAGAVVTKDVPDNVIIAGIPAKIIKQKENG